MKKNTVILFIFSLLITTSSFAETSKFQWVGKEWTNGKWSAESSKPILYGAKVYIDKSSFKSFEGKVYWWSMMDEPKPDENGFLSSKFYKEGDCQGNRTRTLSQLSYREPLATGESHYKEITNKEWYVWPNDLMPASDLGRVCKYFSIDY